jgi:molecular chaperone GrpE
MPNDKQPPAAGQAASPNEPAEGAEGEAQGQLLEQLRADLEEAKDRVLRGQAELDNYRKRAAREVEEHRRYANLPLVRDLLPVVDNVERAIAAAEKTHDLASLLEGIKAVARLLEEALKRHHCVRIPALHEPFDPNLHQAISQQPSNEYPPGTVVLESQPGFRLHERVVRPSQVIVSTTPAPEKSHED